MPAPQPQPPRPQPPPPEAAGLESPLMAKVESSLLHRGAAADGARDLVAPGAHELLEGFSQSKAAVLVEGHGWPLLTSQRRLRLRES